MIVVAQKRHPKSLVLAAAVVEVNKMAKLERVKTAEIVVAAASQLLRMNLVLVNAVEVKKVKTVVAAVCHLRRISLVLAIAVTMRRLVKLERVKNAVAVAVDLRRKLKKAPT